MQDLLNEATTNGSQSALRDLVRYYFITREHNSLDMRYQLFLRDGYSCPFTGLAFAPPDRFVVARATHILPFSFHNKVGKKKF